MILQKQKIAIKVVVKNVKMEMNILVMNVKKVDMLIQKIKIPINVYVMTKHLAI